MDFTWKSFSEFRECLRLSDFIDRVLDSDVAFEFDSYEDIEDDLDLVAFGDRLWLGYFNPSIVLAMDSSNVCHVLGEHSKYLGYLVDVIRGDVCFRSRFDGVDGKFFRGNYHDLGLKNIEVRIKTVVYRGSQVLDDEVFSFIVSLFKGV